MKPIAFSFVFSALVLFLSGSPKAWCADPELLGKVPMHKTGTMVEIGNYHAASGTYEIIDVRLRGQGPFYATMEELVQAVPALNLERLKKNPESIISNQYKIDGFMRVLAPFEVEELAKKKKSKKRR